MKSDDMPFPDSLIERELTPATLRCWAGHCAGVHELKDGRLLVIGKKTNTRLSKEIESRVGDDEQAIVIGREFFAGLFPSKV